MQCKNCKAYGVDHLGFRGCLIGHVIQDLRGGGEGCKRCPITINKEIVEVITTDPRAKEYEWVNQKKGE